MLFGLNACIPLGACITPKYFRYYIKVNDKERFGKVPIVKKSSL